MSEVEAINADLDMFNRLEIVKEDSPIAGQKLHAELRC